MQKLLWVLSVSVCSLLWASFAGAEMSATAIQAMFHPYANGKPSAEGLAPGTRVGPDSWQAAQDYLPVEILDRIKAGELAFEVRETTDLPVSDAYITATQNHAEHVQLGADGELGGYVAGMPFPILDPADAQAGLKAAWNYRHRDFGTIMQIWNTFRLIEESGTVNREIENYYVVAYGMHRPPTDGPDPNIWQEEGLLYKEYYHITAPFDLKNTISLKHRHVRDQAKDDDWVYSPAGRKIRKIIVKHEDVALDSGLLNDDYFGFSGYIRSYTWKLVGIQTLLAPVGVQAAKTTFGGRGGWYPVDPWELREMVVLEGVPKADDHPYGKRVLYIDRQMFVPVYALMYDRTGAHAKTLFELYGNPKFNPGNEQVRVPVWTGETMIDYQNAFGSVTEVTKIICNEPMPADFFNLNKIVARGR